MTDLTYDPELPFVVRLSSGDRPRARFRQKIDADIYAQNYLYAQVIDTTPPPPLPEEHGVWIFSSEGSKYPSNLMLHLYNGWFVVWNTDGSPHALSDAEVRENLTTARKIA